MKGSVRIAVARLGFEPKQEEPESSVLPLYYRAIWEYKNNTTG